jgi:hypothetical protein
MAQAYPSRPVRWVVGFAPACGNDIVARLTGQWLSERTGQQFIVENRPAAATNIATEIVVNAPADGYTLLLVGVSAAINTTLYDNLTFSFLRDIAPAAGIMSIPLFLVTNPSVPARTLPEFPGLRGERVVRRGRTQRHAGRGHRQDQQGDRRGPRRSPDEGAVCRSGRRADADDAGRVHQAHRRRDREVRQGDPKRRKPATPKDGGRDSMLRCA